MRFFAENIKGETKFEDEDMVTVSGVYLHGELEKLNGYDIVDQFLKDGVYVGHDEFIEKVEVIFADGSKHDAVAYIWKSPSQYEMNKHSPYPVRKTYESLHGLICAVDDEKANAYALEKFNARAWHI